MQVIPSIDLTKDRSRLVWWPGASAGAGAPTDRPDVGYAMIFPSMTILKILFAQVAAALFGG